jgi:dTDP-4-amino-4,6-dideoxygalactose transaminase
VSEQISDRLLRLPFYNDLSQSEQNEVVDAVSAFDCHEVHEKVKV